MEGEHYDAQGMMMRDESFDAQGMLTRAGEVFKEIRHSEAYPALLGGVAGGVAGALMAVLIAGRMSTTRTVIETSDIEAKSAKSWSVHDIVQLATIATTLVRQAQAWYQEHQENQART